MTFLVPAGRRRALSVLAGAALLAGASGALAQTYPTSTVRIIVGFGPGSTADILARLVAKHMETSFGQPVVVENRLGNSSMTAAQIVSRAPKDGYTLFMATVANTLNPVQTGAAFNLGTELEPIALLGVNPNVLVVHPSVPTEIGEGTDRCREDEAELAYIRHVRCRHSEPSRRGAVQRARRHRSYRCTTRAAPTRA